MENCLFLQLIHDNEPESRLPGSVGLCHSVSMLEHKKHKLCIQKLFVPSFTSCVPVIKFHKYFLF